eukprot:3937198-Rhodomonas_salina.3
MPAEIKHALVLQLNPRQHSRRRRGARGPRGGVAAPARSLPAAVSPWARPLQTICYPPKRKPRAPSRRVAAYGAWYPGGVRAPGSTIPPRQSWHTADTPCRGELRGRWPCPRTPAPAPPPSASDTLPQAASRTCEAVAALGEAESSTSAQREKQQREWARRSARRRSKPEPHPPLPPTDTRAQTDPGAEAGRGVEGGGRGGVARVKLVHAHPRPLLLPPPALAPGVGARERHGVRDPPFKPRPHQPAGLLHALAPSSSAPRRRAEKGAEQGRVGDRGRAETER